MTATIDLPGTATAPAPTRRVWNVVRMQVSNPFPTLIFPWVITAVIFGLTLATELMVVRAAGGVENLEPDAFQYNGGITWIAVFMLVTAVQAMNLTFRFALGFSVTRRDFYLGSSVYFVLLALFYCTGITALAGVEQATDGWGIGAAFFAPWGLVSQPLPVIWVTCFMALLLFFFLGVAASTLWVRWRVYGLYGFFLGLAVVLVGLAWGITATNRWGALGDYLVSHSLLLIAAWSLPVTLACAVIGYLFLRRATPRL